MTADSRKACVVSALPLLRLLYLPACSSLYFYCNRPTVAALITMGLDVGAAASGPEEGADGAAGEADGGEGGSSRAEGDACQVEGKAETAGAAAAVALAANVEEAVDQASRGVTWLLLHINSTCGYAFYDSQQCRETATHTDSSICCACCPLQLQLLGAGAQANRIMFRLTASLGTLQVLTNYEGSGCHTLSQVQACCCSAVASLLGLLTCQPAASAARPATEHSLRLYKND